MTDEVERINAYLANEKGYEATTANRLLAEALDRLEVLEAALREQKHIDEDNRPGSASDWAKINANAKPIEATSATGPWLPSESKCSICGEWIATDAIDAHVAAHSPPTEPKATGDWVRGTIYIASKTTHAERWRFLRDKVGEPIISTWIDEAGEGETADWDDLWRRCLAEASRADVTIIYHEPGEVLKGALVEVGAALSHGHKVIVVGDPPGTWCRTSGILRAADMKEAIAAARKIDAAPSPPKTAGGTVTEADLALAVKTWLTLVQSRAAKKGFTLNLTIAETQALKDDLTSLLTAVFALRSPQGTEDGPAPGGTK